MVVSISVFAFLYIFTGVIGVNFYNSIWGSLERMGGIISFVHFWFYFLILISIIKEKKDWEKILKLSVLVGFLSILFGYGQRLALATQESKSLISKFFVGWQHGERVIGTIGNPALFAGYLLFIIYLAIFFLIRKDIQAKEKGFYAAVLILGIPILFMTAVRGAVFSFFISLLLLAIFYIFFSSGKKIKTYLIVAIIVFLALGFIIVVDRNQSWVKNTAWLQRLTNVFSDTSTMNTRLWSWNSALKGWKERPIFGWGPENFTFLHSKYFDSRHFTQFGSETIWDRAHNMVLEVLSTMGVVGLASYLFVFIAIFYLLIKAYKEKRIDKIYLGIFGAMIVAYFSQNLFIFDTSANYLLFFLVAGYISFITKKETEDNTVKEGAIVNPSVFLMIVLMIFALIAVYFINIKPAKANYACTRAIIAGQQGNAQEVVNKYREALSYKTSQGAYEIRHKLATFVIQYSEALRQKNKELNVELIHYAINEVQKNIEKYPMDTVPLLYAGRLYIILVGKEDDAGPKAEDLIRKAISLNDKNPRIWYELGQDQLLMKKYQESYNSFKKAYDLNPQVVISNWFLGIAAFYLGNYQEAVERVEKAMEMGYSDYENSIADLMRLVNVYEKVGDYYSVVKYYEMAVEEQPTNPQIHASLAVAYAKIGQKALAIEQARKAAEIDPEFKDESEKFINSLPK
jgi:O-antigen ligase/tetratricopeptide (TPR) repeat protein